MANARITDVQHRIDELVGMRDALPGWSTPVINPAPTGLPDSARYR